MLAAVRRARLAEAERLVSRPQVQRGYDISSGEVTEGVIAIAVPVFDPDGKIIGALTVNALKYRTKEKRVRNALKILKDAAGKLSNRLPAELVAMDGY